MSDKSNEQISNLMDGELEINASKFLLKRMIADESLSNTWNSYHLIKSCLQKEEQEPLIVDVASRVRMELLGDQSNHILNNIEPSKNNISLWSKALKPVMGFSIAASVAFVSVFLLQNQNIDSVMKPIILANTIAKSNIISPILETNISANVVASGRTLLPPPSLSRFPFASSSNSSIVDYNINTPYLIIINKSANITTNGQLSPMKTKDFSD